MKNLKIVLILSLLVSFNVSAQVTDTQLMGLGMPAALATTVASIGQGSAVMNNASYLKWRNAANSANLNVMRVDSNNDVVINAPSTRGIYFQYNGSSGWILDSSGNWVNDTSTGGQLQLTKPGTTIAIQESTAGAACSGSLTFNGTTPVVTSTTCASTGARIFLTRTSAESTALNPYVSAISNGVSFSVTSEAGDTGTANWFIIKEAP